jgi:predicted metal-dependent phosphoesterase TrpH
MPPDMSEDLHTHTFVSDGDLSPTVLLAAAAERGIAHLSITDHDSLGAYSWEEGAVFSEARSRGIRLTVGIELDAILEGFEIHVLGFDLDLRNAALNDHLDRAERARAERARTEIGIVNSLLGDGTLTEAQIFVPGRRTLMKPHFIHPLLDQRRFSTYEEANAWFKKNVKAGVPVPKPSAGEVLALIKGARGWSSLAHPGYYQKSGLDLLAHIPALQKAGLDAVELDYPYHSCSPHLFSQEAEADLRRSLGGLPLRFTRGSDAHTLKDLERVYSPGVWGV